MVKQVTRPKDDEWVLLHAYGMRTPASGSIAMDAKLPDEGSLVTLLGRTGTDHRNMEQFNFKHVLSPEAIVLIDEMSEKGIAEEATINAITYWSNRDITSLTNMLNSDPYKFIQSGGIEFKVVDRLRSNFKISDTSKTRLRAIVNYFYFNSAGENLVKNSTDTVGNMRTLQYNCLAYIEPIHRKTMLNYITSNSCSIPPGGFDKPSNVPLLVKINDKLISHRKHYMSAWFIAKYAQGNNNPFKRVLSSRKEIDDKPLVESQRMAIGSALKNKFSIITGCAGYGKTTIVKALAEALTEKKYANTELILCTPTGKAVARLKEMVNTENVIYDIRTIHSVLGFNGRTFTASNFKDTIIVIDEASMVDSKLLANVVQRLPIKLILVGDSEQLPPVGEGQPFRDLISMFPDKVLELTHNFRAKAAINSASTAIRASEAPVAMSSEGEEFRLSPYKGLIGIKSRLYDLYEEGQLDFTQDIVITYTNDVVDDVNTCLKELANPGSGLVWTIGDRIMFSQNNYDKGYVNGDVAIINGITGTKNKKYTLTLVDTNHTVQLTSKEMNTCKHAYALTVHKSQGSEYRNVYYILTGSGFHISRSLVYTAVTRAKKVCDIMGNIELFNKGFKEPIRETVIKHIPLEK
jgi:RecD/TraA family predicted helicase